MTRFVVLGAAGHVGGAVARTLLDRQSSVTVLTREADHVADLVAQGAEVAECDVNDADALRKIFKHHDRAFLLNPPGDTGGDSDAEEIATAEAIAAAVRGSGLERVVVHSTYGAQDCEQCGDLGTLYRFEAEVKAAGVPASVLRAAYYYSNFDAQLDEAREAGTLTTPLPADLAIPMVSPDDLGRADAELLTADAVRAEPLLAEGPRRLSVTDVAAAFGRALHREVRVVSVPREGWEAMFTKLGFSGAAARSYACMTGISVDAGFEVSGDPWRGTVTIDDHVAALVTGA